MTKLLATTTLLLTLLVSPLMAKEIIMKCDVSPIFWDNKTAYYKYKPSLFGDTYYVKQDIKWVKFCDIGIGKSISGYAAARTLKHSPTKIIKGDRAVRCSFNTYYEKDQSTGNYFQDVDFERKEATSVVVVKGEELGMSEQCTTVSED